MATVLCLVAPAPLFSDETPYQNLCEKWFQVVRDASPRTRSALTHYQGFSPTHSPLPAPKLEKALNLLANFQDAQKQQYRVHAWLEQGNESVRFVVLNSNDQIVGRGKRTFDSTIKGWRDGEIFLDAQVQNLGIANAIHQATFEQSKSGDTIRFINNNEQTAVEIEKYQLRFLRHSAYRRLLQVNPREAESWMSNEITRAANADYDRDPESAPKWLRVLRRAGWTNVTIQVHMGGNASFQAKKP